MSSTTVSLESLHFLLQHMDANRRFEISQRCPSLREFEKTVPLNIKYLELKENCVIVNDTTYKIGIIRKCKVGEAPRYVAENNEEGGVAYEVDGYGIEDKSDALTVTPGDFGMNQLEQLIHNEEVNIEDLEEELRTLEEELADERGRRPNRNLEHFQEMEKNIEDARAELFDYQCRRDHIPSRYEFFLQLTKSRTVDEKEQKSIERYEHNKKFSVVMKQLATVLFGGRNSPIHVTKFKILLYDVIRLPVDLKLRIERLVFCADLLTKVGVLAPILDESSFPLKELEIEFWSDEDDPIVNTAEVLKIGNIVMDVPATISFITNPVVHVLMNTEPEKEIIEQLLMHWNGSERPVGSNYIFDFESDLRFPNEVEDMRMLKLYDVEVIDDENIIIPLITTQIKISYGPFPEFAPTSKWAVRFLTEAIENRYL